MDAALEENKNETSLEKALAMASFKILYQKNRNEKKPSKMKFDELGFYYQFFEGKDTIGTVMKYKNLNNKGYG